MQMMKLWSGEMPYYNSEIDFEPHILPYICDGAKLAVVVCPGGGYGGRCEYEGEEIGEWFNTIGITGYVLEYRVSPYRAPAIPSDVQRGMRMARADAEKRGIKKVGVMGFSAGGHLAATASVHWDKKLYEPTDEIDRLSARPDFSVLCYPVIDMFDFRHDGTRVCLLDERNKKADREFYSLHKQVTDDTPPAFLWHNCSDQAVPAENSLLYAAALSEHNISYELHVFPYGMHGGGLCQGDSYIGQWTHLLERWIKEIVTEE